MSITTNVQIIYLQHTASFVCSPSANIHETVLLPQLITGREYQYNMHYIHIVIKFYIYKHQYVQQHIY